MYNQFLSMIQPYAEKLENLLKIGTFTRVKGLNGQLQEVQLKTLRNIEDAFKYGQFGFNSKAPLESRAVVAKIGNNKVVIANEHIASIIDVNQGDSIIYNENGDYIKVEKDTITIKAKNIIHDCENFTVNASTKFTVNSPESEFSNIVNSLGLFSALGYSGLSGSDMTTNVNIISNGINLTTHYHTQPNDSNGNSEANTSTPTN